MASCQKFECQGYSICNVKWNFKNFYGNIRLLITQDRSIKQYKIQSISQEEALVCPQQIKIWLTSTFPKFYNLKMCYFYILDSKYIPAALKFKKSLE